MILRNYSRDLALQFNFVPEESTAPITTPAADNDGQIAHLVLFGFEDSRINIQMSFMWSSSLWQRFQRHFSSYHFGNSQLAVEAGEKAATRLLELQKQARAKLTGGPGKTAEGIVYSIDMDQENVLRHLAGNDPHIRVSPARIRSTDQFSFEALNAAD